MYTYIHTYITAGACRGAYIHYCGSVQRWRRKELSDTTNSSSRASLLVLEYLTLGTKIS